MTASLLVAGCASAPPFSPSRPLSEASSSNEALLLCDEYRMPEPAKRPIAFRPFRDCVNEVADRFGGDTGVVAFARELDFEYSLLRDDSWVAEQGRRMSIATHALLRALATARPVASAGSFTPSERDDALFYFPRTSRRLAVEDWPTSQRVALDPKLELLKAQVQGEFQRSRARAVTQTGEVNPALCQRWQRLNHETQYLSGLWRDSSDLAQIDSTGDATQKVRDRYQKRLAAATQELQALQADANGSVSISACQ